MTAKTESLVDIGSGHNIRFVEYNGEKRVGLNDYHKRPDDGSECQGFVAFEGRAWANVWKDHPTPPPTWKVEQWEPLTLSPSLLCRSCGDHGFIREGKWVRA